MTMKSRNEVSFLVLIKGYKLTNFIFSVTFFVSVIFTGLCIYITANSSKSGLSDLFGFVQNTGVGVGAALMAIVVAGLAIITALTASSISAKLLYKNLLHRLLFPFWLAALFWTIFILIGVFSLMVTNIFSLTEQKVIIDVSVFVFVYSLGTTLGLVGNSIQIGVKFAKLQDVLDQDEES